MNAVNNPVAPSLIDELRRDLETSAALDSKCLVEASRRLGVSPRTLQRRLVEQGTSFSVELEQARKKRALQLLATTAQPLLAVARELGFADASTFSRAFQRWFARAPGATRGRSRASGPGVVVSTAQPRAASFDARPRLTDSQLCSAIASDQRIFCAPPVRAQKIALGQGR